MGIWRSYGALAVVMLAASLAVALGAGGAVAQSEQPITVVTKPAPPFAMQSDKGEWNGLAVELFSEISSKLGRDVRWSGVETTKELIDTVSRGEADAGIAAVTITSEREKSVDFSHSYYASGLAIAVARHQGSGFVDVLRALASPAFLTTVGMLGMLLLATGALIWVVERRANSQQFDADPVKGIGSGFWWSAVTMTTVGYGDKAPVTPLGRGIAVIWMFAALILTAVFTAQLTSSLTVGQISGPVAGLDDLPRARVGVVEKSASNEYFAERFIQTQSYKDVPSGLAALDAGSIDAFVHDEPILKFQVHRDYPGRIDLLAQVFEPQDYGIVLPAGSPLREEANQALLEMKNSEAWLAMKARYFGRD